MESSRSVFAAEASHAVIRKHFVPLHKAVADRDVQMKLYSLDLLDEGTTRSMCDSPAADRGRKIVFILKDKISERMDDSVIHQLCKVLEEKKDDKLDSLVQDIRLSYEKEVEAMECAKQARIPGRNELECLKKQLEAFKLTSQMQNPPEGLKTVIERTLQNYIETSLEANLKPESTRDHLNELGSLLSSEMLAWVLEELDNIVKRQEPHDALEPKPTPGAHEIIPPPVAGATPLSPSILYHASLVCHAVNAYGDTNSVQEFLKQGKHELREASFSLPNDDVDRYLIAKNGSTIYVGFRSKSSLRHWQSRYKSFAQGLKDQTTKIPLRFFIEQLLKKKKIVFTGFSFGGMLASAVTSQLWDAGFLLSVALLEKNVMCVTFGQPLINIPYVTETIERFPALGDTIHLVMNSQDKVPSILHYLQIGCIVKDQGPGDAPCPVAPTGFETPFSQDFIQGFCTLQQKAIKLSYSSALQSSGNSPSKMSPGADLAAIMKDLRDCGAKEFTHPNMLFGKLYLLKDKRLNEINKSVAFKELLHDILLEEIIEKSFKYHTAEVYHSEVLLSKPIKEHITTIPPTAVTRVQGVIFLKPKATTVEFHMYPTEHVIVLEGNNLWFCHKVRIGQNDNSITIDSPSNITRRSIQFNFKPSDKTERLCENGGVHVTLYSHFAQESSKRLRATKEPYLFSLRQIQLAKHTPTELIQLAYFTAMLEKSVCQTTTSKRYEVVKRFLEETGKIVPLESVFHVIAHGNKDAALQCGKALQASGTEDFPPSYMMLLCSQKAAARVSTGLTEEEFIKQHQKPHMMLEGGVEVIFPTAAMPVPKPGPSSSPLRHSQRSKGKRSKKSRTNDSKTKLYSEVAEKIQVPPGLPPIHRLNLLFPPVRDFVAVSLQDSRSQELRSEFPYKVQGPSVMSPVTTIKSKLQFGAIPMQSPLDSELAAYLKRVYADIDVKARGQGDQLPVISGRSIEHFCPFSLNRTVPGATMQSPIQALIDARRHLMAFSEAAYRKQVSSPPSQSSLQVNEEMIQVVKRIQEYSLCICSALLAGFMEQQIRIPLVKSHLATAKVLSSAHTPVAMGSWAFLSMGFQDIHEIVMSSESSPMIVEIGDYITSVIEQARKTSGSATAPAASLPADINYADKLLFLVQGIKTGKTVSCSTQFISYTLERQLNQLSKELKFDKTLTVKRMVSEWDSAFKNNALSLVATSHRPLIARWLKWALLVHDLRETLAEYMCVGIIGLSNSGKSHLVNTLFDVQAHVGTTERKRTVVPFLYNMDGRVDKLDIIDFPGVDDVSTVLEVTKLLVNLAQIVIFVVDYRNIGSKISIEWLKQLGNEDLHVLVCLTHADILYDEVVKDLQDSDTTTSVAHRIKQELAQTEEKVGRHPSRTMKYFCFDFSKSVNLTCQELKEVGISSPIDVGDWLVETFDHKLAQHDLAEKLKKYLNMR